MTLVELAHREVMSRLGEVVASLDVFGEQQEAEVMMTWEGPLLVLPMYREDV